MNIIRKTPNGEQAYEQLPNGDEVLIGSGKWLLLDPITEARPYRGYTILRRAIPEGFAVSEPWKGQCNPTAYHCYREEWTPEDREYFIQEYFFWFTSGQQVTKTIDFWEDSCPPGFVEENIRDLRISRAKRVLFDRLTDVEHPPELRPEHVVDCYMRATCVAAGTDSSPDFITKMKKRLAEEASK